MSPVKAFFIKYILSSAVNGDQPKRSTLSSRLSEKLQASLSTDKEQDDDFKTDRKRLRTPTTEQKVLIQIIFFDII